MRAAKKFPGLKGMDLAKAVSTKKIYQWNDGLMWKSTTKPPRPQSRLHVVAYDFGMKRNILRILAEHGCRMTVVPAQTPADQVFAMNPDGIFLANGPGDPEPCDYAIEAIARFLETDLPIFGICLGHQLLGLASGAKTLKMKFGHHGANHPVLEIDSGRVLISSQNHGFAVDEIDLAGDAARHAPLAIRRFAAGRGAHRSARLQLPGAPGGKPRPARCAAVVRTLHVLDGETHASQFAGPQSRQTEIGRELSAEANRPRQHPHHRRGTHHHRSGLRVRLFWSSSV